jgi:molybdenum cofactor cytidylyltransferase
LEKPWWNALSNAPSSFVTKLLASYMKAIAGASSAAAIPKMKQQPTIIILALGHRVHAPSWQTHQHNEGAGAGEVSALAATLHRATASQLPVVVVTTLELAALVNQTVAMRDMVVLPASSAQGIGESIAAGVAARSNATGWLILPAHMARVLPGTLLAVASALQLHPVARAQHHGRGDQLVGFSAELYSELFTLKGDQACRRLLARYPVKDVEVNDPGVLVSA